MIKHFCDRCGCEMDSARIASENIIFTCTEFKKELCNACVTDMYDFLGNRDLGAEWYDAEEVLPNTNRDVLITYEHKIGKHREIAISNYDYRSFGGNLTKEKQWREPWSFFHQNNKVVAWSELPKAWEG